MNRKYPLKMFVFGVLLNFILRYFYLFVPGVLLCFAGLWLTMCLLIGLAVLGLDLILSIMDQFEIRKATLSHSENQEFNEFMDAFCNADDPDAFKKLMQEKMDTQAEEEDQTALQHLTVYRILNDSIREDMTLEEMICAFETMCKTSVGEPDDVLFETGTYPFSGEKRFYFCLVRQFQFLDDNEYVQLHLEVTYEPRAKTNLLYNSKWGSPLDPEFYSMVKSSKAFRTVRELPMTGVKVWVDRT